MRSVSCGVMPATGSSTSSSSGSCISSMPISSHCFWPCDRVPASDVRAAAARPMISSTSSMRSRCAGVRRATQRPPERLVAGQRQLEVLEHRQLLEHGRLLKLAADAGLGDFRLGQREQVDLRPEPRRALIRARLAGDDVHHRGLAGAVRTDDAAQLSRVDVQRQLVERLEAVEADGQLLEIEDLAREQWRRPPRRVAHVLRRSSIAGLDRVHRRLIARRHRSSPMSPRGRNSVTSTNSAPSA